MTNDQHQRGRAIVDERCGFGLTQNGERALEIRATLPATARFQIELYIIISGSDAAEYFAGALGQRRPSEVRVNDNAGPIDYRLDAAGAQIVNRGADKIDSCVRVRDLAPFSNLRELAADKI